MAIEINEGENLVEKKEGSGQNYNHKLKRIDFCDRRVYQRSEDVYYPSVTTILTAFPVDIFFLEWLSDVGKNGDIIKKRAAKEGTMVHNAIEALCKGETVSWIDNYGNAKYPLNVWQMILRFKDFYETYHPEILENEQFIYSDKYQFAGTLDCLCRLNGETWLIDFKTSNAVHPSYMLQLAAYQQGLRETKGIEIDRAGILWLKSSTRKHSDKEGIYQGEGWQLKEAVDLDEAWKAFLHTQALYHYLNTDIKPLNKTYPTEIELD